MLITPANLSIFFTGVSTLFWGAYGATTPFIDRIATRIPSTTETETYGWMGYIPTMQEWIGPRKLQNVASQGYSLTNKPYELTLQVDKFKLADDQYGLYGPMSVELGMQGRKWPDYQWRDLVRNRGSQTGAYQKCMDGLNYFSNVHPVDFYDASKGTYSNDFTSAGSGATPLTAAGFNTVFTAMNSYVKEDGESLEIVPDLLIIPSQLQYVARTILNTSFIAPSAVGGITMVGSSENVLQGWADILVLPELNGDATTWYLACTSRAIKPFIFQERQAVNFVSRIAPDDPAVFDLHQYLYGTDARGAVGWSFPWLCARGGA